MQEFTQDTTAKNKRIAKNTISLYVRQIVGLLVALYTSKAVLQVLGVEDFGIQSVVGGFISMFGFLNNTLSSSLQRYFNFEGSKRGDKGFTDVYNTSWSIQLLLSLILLILFETIGLWYVNHVMVIPADRLFVTNILYQVTAVSTILVVLQIPYVGLILSNERMDFYASVGIFDVISRLVFVFFLPCMAVDKLVSFAFFSQLITVSGFMMYLFYCKRHFGLYKMSLQRNPVLFKSILNFSFWNFVGTFGIMMKSQGLNMLLNFFLGPTINAARSLAYQVKNAVSHFSVHISTAFRPQMVNSYADRDYNRTTELMFVQTKACFLLVTLLTLPFIFEADYVLGLWLRDVPDYTAPFAILILIDNIVFTLYTPIQQIAHAVGKLMYFQIISFICNILILPLGWFVLSKGYSPSSVYYVMILMSVIHQVACLWQLSRIFEIRLIQYLKNVILPCLFLLCLLLPVPGYICYNYHDSFYRFVSVGVIVVVSGLTLSYLLFLNGEEKSLVKQIIKRNIFK